ncbi:hypothetical protein ACJX0J_026060, partial [Zea mays]
MFFLLLNLSSRRSGHANCYPNLLSQTLRSVFSLSYMPHIELSTYDSGFYILYDTLLGEYYIQHNSNRDINVFEGNMDFSVILDLNNIKLLFVDLGLGTSLHNYYMFMIYFFHRTQCQLLMLGFLETIGNYIPLIDRLLCAPPHLSLGEKQFNLETDFEAFLRNWLQCKINFQIRV